MRLRHRPRPADRPTATAARFVARMPALVLVPQIAPDLSALFQPPAPVFEIRGIRALFEPGEPVFTVRPAIRCLFEPPAPSLVLVPGTGGPEVYPNGFKYRREQRLPALTGTGETVTRPLPIIETDATLRSEANGGHVVSSAGNDIRFELADGTVLPGELDVYDPAAGRVVFWPRQAYRTDALQVAGLYYGKTVLAAESNAAQAWRDAVAVLAWPAGTDLTGRGRAVAPTAVTAGELVGKAGVFAATSKALGTTALGTALQGLTEWTLELLVRATATGLSRALVRAGSASDVRFLLASLAAGSTFQASFKVTGGTISLTGSSSLQSTSTLHLMLTHRSGLGPTLYVNGKAVTPSAISGATLTGGLQLAGYSPGFGDVLGDATGFAGTLGKAIWWPRYTSLREALIAAQSQLDPRAVSGLGAEDRIIETTAALSPVAQPVQIAAEAGKAIDIDFLAASFRPGGTVGATASIAELPGQGAAVMAGGKIRYTPLSTYEGTDRLLGRITRGGKTSTAAVLATVTKLVTPPPDGFRLLTRDPFPPDATTWTQLVRKAAAGCTAGNLPSKRCAMGTGPSDGIAGSNLPVQSLIHTVNTGDTVVDVAHIPYYHDVSNTSARQFMLRYVFYPTAYHGREGKIITFEGGWGYAGHGPNDGGWFNEHVHPAQHAKSTDGWACFTMHPEDGSNGNHIKGYGCYQNMNSDFGVGFGGGPQYNIDQWNTVDVVMQGPPSAFLKVYQNGKLIATKTGIGNVAYHGNLAGCNILFWMIRLMYGGTPSELPPFRKVVEYFGPVALYKGNAP